VVYYKYDEETMEYKQACNYEPILSAGTRPFWKHCVCSVKQLWSISPTIFKL